MRVLVACEFSGVVRDAFIRLGHDAVSCDLIESELPGPHIQDDVLNHLSGGWDMLVAFPPCTYLASSGARWFGSRLREQSIAIEFVQALMVANIYSIAVENPVGVLSSKICKPTQIIQPYQFGHSETKATCLWLKNLPKLRTTEFMIGWQDRVHRLSPSINRWKLRSRTLQGIAQAMALQWGGQS